MDGFYISLIFIGILLVIFSLILIFFDKKKSFGFIKSFEAKKQELVDIINDAELMIEELNKFSDYIVNQMDLKNEELKRNLADAEMRIEKIREQLEAAVSETTARMHKLDGIRSEAVTQNDSQNSKAFASAAYIAQSSAVSQLPSVQQTGVKRADKVIPLKNKYSEVIRLSGEGLQSTAIAQKLNMGKGEVELILGLRR